tara:strand:- start:388 stop:897 length:510 start_codon:yes stop_codon:yes gene_type:complete
MEKSGKNFSNKLTGQIGENLVVAELGRRGIVATAFAGNVPDIDILAYKNGKSLALQVKSIKTGSVLCQVDNYLDIEIKDKKQIITGIKKSSNRKIIWIIVSIGPTLGTDKFYICDGGFFQDTVLKIHSDFLKKHGGIRPKKYDSFHCAVQEKDLISKLDDWNKIEDNFN